LASSYALSARNDINAPSALTRLFHERHKNTAESVAVGR
jgi:hypothetical protein